MKWWCVAACACVVLATCVYADNDTAIATNNAPVTAVVIASALSGDTALALRDLAVLVLKDSGVHAEPAAAPKSCSSGDEATCVTDVVRAFSKSNISVALVSVPAENVPDAWQLREIGIVELNEVAPPSRRACLATRSPARSLLDLAEANVAANYVVPNKEIELALRKIGMSVECNDPDCIDNIYTPEWCKQQNTSCATLLTTSSTELHVLSSVIRSNKLHATVLALGTRMYAVADQLSSRPIIACDWAPEFSPLSALKAERLGPPVCLPSEPCPFETRRLVKFGNIRELSRTPIAIGAMVRFKLNTTDIRDLGVKSRQLGHEQAAKIFFETKPFRKPFEQVRVAVMLPGATSREAYDATALEAAAALAEVDVEAQGIMETASFKVETYDDGCHTVQAYKYLHDALGHYDFNLLSAIAGPACGAAWADMARQTSNFRLPVLAYTPQAPASATKAVSIDCPDTKLQLLAAGDARESSEIFGELVARMGWKRVAVLSEHATRPLVDAARKHVEFAVHVQMPLDVPDVNMDLINTWVTRVAEADARIMYLCVEDGRVARAALCAARHVHIAPSTGAVWLLCNEPTPQWLTAGAGDNCTTEQLQEIAAGYITVRPEWENSWYNPTTTSEVRNSWEARWRTHCRRRHIVSRGSKNTSLCHVTPHADAAVLYDTLMMWATALNRLLKKQPAAVNDLHNTFLVSSLMQDVTTTNFSGLTGNFKWTTKECAYARSVSYVLSQWDAKHGERNIGYWSNGTLNLNGSLHWFTADGNIPDDGAEYCALQGLADTLHADCRAAYATLGCLLAIILIGILAGVALYCRRRAEKEYKERLAELGMRPLLGKPVGLDRWEVPRERVVINRKLGTGAFGTVYGGHALLSEGKNWTAVAVKVLKAGASMEEKLDFLSEAEAMKRFDYKNVVRLLGVVTKTEPVCTVMEFMLYGDLKNYLLARRHLAMGLGFDDELDSGEADEASPRRLTGMALDVARGLSYLASLRYVHRDVAARNCLISARRAVKLADFGMTRLVFEHDYYRFSRKGMLPVRWMAPESLALGVFSPASDVWSFGVLLYEIVTFGSLPFQGYSNAEVLNKVKGGHTLELPLGLKPQLEDLIKSCWQQDPKNRPSATELAVTLADAPRLLSPCLDVPFDALPLDSDPPWHLPRDQAEARWVSWAAASAATDTTYLSSNGCPGSAPASAATDTSYFSSNGSAIPLDTESFLP